jgi:hypothetical protein
MNTGHFSESQRIALAILPKLTGFLSMVASFWIIVEVLTDIVKRSNVYHRLLLGMSLVDLISSISYFASTWPVPSGTDDVTWAIGNERSCSLQGLFLQFGVASPV